MVPRRQGRLRTIGVAGSAVAAAVAAVLLPPAGAPGDARLVAPGVQRVLGSADQSASPVRAPAPGDAPIPGSTARHEPVLRARSADPVILEVDAPADEHGAAPLRLTIDGGRTGLRPALSMVNARPGDRGTMFLRVRNAGSANVDLHLRRAGLYDRPGPYGGRLSHALQLAVAAEERPLYAGSLVGLPTVRLGVVPPGDSRLWSLSLAFPDGGRPAGPRAGDNRWQGAAARVRYAIRARVR